MWMKSGIALIAVLTDGAGRMQSLISREAAERVSLMTSDSAVFDLNDLACSVATSGPDLGYGSLFRTGYQVSSWKACFASAKEGMNVDWAIRSLDRRIL